MSRMAVLLMAAMFTMTTLASDADAGRRGGGWGKSPSKSYSRSYGKSYGKPSGRSYSRSYSAPQPSFPKSGWKGPKAAAPVFKAPALPRSNSPSRSGGTERSRAERQRFLDKTGLKKAPPGWEVDHVVPLADGGADRATNMQLLPKESHRRKTSAENRRRAARSSKTSR